MGNKRDGLEVQEGDLLHFVTWGGGGWGDPLERDPELVGLEIRRGLVTPQGARDYGVVCDDKGRVDANATEALRGEIRASRSGEPKLFNSGPDIDTLRANCLEETGLPAPRQPVWAEHR